MFSKLVHKKFSLISYIFFNSLLSGLILIGICSSFSLMLSEKGVGVSSITSLLLSTIPYSWKFVISPFVKNIIKKYSSKNIIKFISIVAQIIIFVLFSSLGFFGNKNLWIAGLLIPILVIAVCVQDIVRAYIKLVIFKTENLGIISAIENTGFRIGMFISGACIIYIANITSWALSFVIIGFIVIFAMISTLCMKVEDIPSSQKNLKENSFKEYIKGYCEFLKGYKITILVLVIISFKLTDSCISVLKPIFFHYLGISRLDFANITHLVGIFSMITSGIVAGSLLYKIGMKNCIKITFILQMIASLIFMYFSAFKSNLLTITILVNISTFIFGFSGVVFRTFAAENSKKDINIYATLLSFGSLIRILSYSFAGVVVEQYSWGTIYFICLLSNIPGYFLYLNLRKGK